MSNLLTEKELCTYLGVNKCTLWRLRQEGLPFVRIGNKIIRYCLEDVLNWLHALA